MASSLLRRFGPRALYVRPAGASLARRAMSSATTSKGSTEQETIVRLLYTMGGREEVEQYLQMFSSVESPKFAVIKIGGAVLDEEMDTLTTSLTFLHKVGLYPIVLHGAGPQLNKNLEKAGIEAVYHEGIRVTDPKTLEIARKVFYGENMKLVEALEKLGTRTRPITTGTFVADFLDKPRYNLVGKITGVNTSAIESAIRTGALPILTSLAETPDGQILNVNADVAASELAKVIQPLKVVYLSGQGGLYNGDTNEKIDVINLDEEFDRLMQQPWVKYGTKLKIREINELLQHLPRNASVSITNATNLSRELFTHKGAGTLLRRGNKLEKHASLDTIDKKQLAAIIESNVVGHSGVSVNNLISLLADSKVKIYTDADYQGLAVVREPQPGSALAVPVLEVFAVTHAGQMSNFKDNLWQHLRSDYKQLCWYTNSTTDIKTWFFPKSEGSYSLGDSTVFWYGIEELDNAKSCVNQLINPPSGAGVKASTQGINYTPKRQFSSQRRSYATTSSDNKKIKLGLIGARGYTGNELMKLIGGHSDIQLACVSSRELNGKDVPNFSGLKYSNLLPADCAAQSDVNCWVIALPNNLAKPYADAITQAAAASGSKKVIVDLSADYRFDSTWAYGMPEINREAIKKASLISNPGCYATGCQLSLRPLAKTIGFSGLPSVFGVSGYSGAGTTPSDRNNPEFLKDNLVPYSLTGHMHEKEVSHHLGAPIAFMPHVAPFFQGISLTISVPFQHKTSVGELQEIYKKAYAGEKLVKVTDAIPLVKQNSGKHHLAIGGVTVSKDGLNGVVVCTLDNLLKGAATQALQNINLSFGLPELAGIDQHLS